MCFDLLLPSSMFTSAYFFFDLVFCLVLLNWLQNNVRFCDPYCTVCHEYRIRDENFEQCVYACALMSLYFTYMVNYARKSTTYTPINVDDCVYIQNGKWRTKWHVIWSKHRIWSYLLYQKWNRTVCALTIVQGMHPCKTPLILLLVHCFALWIIRLAVSPAAHHAHYIRRNNIIKLLMSKMYSFLPYIQTDETTVQSHCAFIWIAWCTNEYVHRQTMIVVRIIAALQKLHTFRAHVL